MKVVIFGYSGSGKSTLAKSFHDQYGLPLMHLDRYMLDDKWNNLDLEKRKKTLEDFMKENDSWVIEGNYFKTLFEERLEQADVIIFLNFNRFFCLRQAIHRSHSKDVNLDAAPEGVNYKMRLEFANWVFFTGRSRRRKKIFFDAVNRYKEKSLVFKNRKQLIKYFNEHPLMQ